MLKMLKIFVLLFALALVTEGSPTLAKDLADAAENGRWDVIQTLLRQHTQKAWAPIIAANVEDLKQPDEDTHVYGQAVSTFKQWTNDNGKYSENSGGLEVVNKDGNITRRVFTP